MLSTPPIRMEVVLLAKIIRGDLSVMRALKGFMTLRNQDAASPLMLDDLRVLHELDDQTLKQAADMAGT